MKLLFLDDSEYNFSASVCFIIAGGIVANPDGSAASGGITTHGVPVGRGATRGRRVLDVEILRTKPAHVNSKLGIHAF